MGTDGGRAGVALLTVDFCNFTNTPKSTTVTMDILFSTYEKFPQFCLCPVDTYRQPPQAPLMPSAMPAPCWTATTAHLYHQVPATSHWTYAVWTHCWL